MSVIRVPYSVIRMVLATTKGLARRSTEYQTGNTGYKHEPRTTDHELRITDYGVRRQL